ncbi:MAG: peptide MFS transporter [Flavobacteriales bacterium]|nr:peptide MFS transporter [Flavobacteriales bacterium]
MNSSNSEFFKSNILGHPSGLFVLFFTEMWERFSYYGMRALLVMFFTASLMDEGWGWPREHAFAIFGTYTALVYLSTMLGGYFADKIIGYRWAVVVGAILMTLGHGSMALETQFFTYTGLTLLVFGSGFFKPNMTSIISEMYQDKPEKKDGAYTIFYMGVNAGAFLGIGLCGYLGETVGWSIGFGLAGIFMAFGTLQFWLAQNIFGNVGKVPEKLKKEDKAKNNIEVKEGRSVWFSPIQLVTILIIIAASLIWIINDPVSIISEGAYDVFNFTLFGMQGGNFVIVSCVIIFLILTIYRLSKYAKMVREKLIAVWFFALLTIFFWAIFEQAPGSLTIFARDYTDRVLTGSSGLIFKIINSAVFLVSLGVITWVLFKLFAQTFKKYALSNVILGASFVIVWGITIWMLYNEFQKESTEVPASWFGILNSLFIITFAPLFSKWWESPKYNPNANMKFGIGMGLLALGMAFVAFGAMGIDPGAETASVSMIWLIMVYLFHTLGELCISPIGLSYVSKLVPAKMIAFMYGIWYLAIAIGNKLAHKFGENIDKIAEENGISYFFWILTFVALGMGIISVLATPFIKKLMHGVK